jgi:hypothetical protein
VCTPVPGGRSTDLRLTLVRAQRPHILHVHPRIY